MMRTIFQFEIQQIFEICMTNFLFELFEHLVSSKSISKGEIELVFHDRICDDSSRLFLAFHSGELVLRNEKENFQINGQSILERLYSLTSTLVCFVEQDPSITDEIWSYFGDNFDELNISIKA